MKFSFSLFFAVVLLIACEDDEGILMTEVPVTSKISGPDAVEIASEGVSYSVSQRLGSTYEWSVSDASVSNASTSGTLKIDFTDFPLNVDSTATVTVVETNSNGVQGEEMSKTIKITVSRPTVNVFPASDIPLRKDSSEFILFAFDKPLATAPSLEVLPVVGLTEKGSFGEVKEMVITDTVDIVTGAAARAFWKADPEPVGSVYYAEFTANVGNASAAEVSVSDAVATIEHGGLEMSEASAEISRVDNIGPFAKFTFSDQLVKDGDDSVSVTVTFNEPLTLKIKPGDIKVSFAGGSGIPEMEETVLKTALNDEDEIIDNTVWMFKYLPTEGDGILDFSVTGAVDVAGNEQGVIVPGSKNKFIVDNTDPVLSGESAIEVNDENYGEITLQSNEDGTVFFILIADGSEVPEVADVVGANPSITLNSGNSAVKGGSPVTLNTIVLEDKKYDIYVVIRDDAGNETDVLGPIELSIGD